VPNELVNCILLVRSTSHRSTS